MSDNMDDANLYDEAEKVDGLDAFEQALKEAFEREGIPVTVTDGPAAPENTESTKRMSLEELKAAAYKSSGVDPKKQVPYRGEKHVSFRIYPEDRGGIAMEVSSAPGGVFFCVLNEEGQPVFAMHIPTPAARQVFSAFHEALAAANYDGDMAAYETDYRLGL